MKDAGRGSPPKRRRDRLTLSLPYFIAIVVMAILIHGWLGESSVTVISPHAGEEGPTTESHTSENPVSEGSSFLDPVCGMTVGRSTVAVVGGTARYFCNERCRDLFVATPERFLAETCIVCRADDRLVDVDPLCALDWEGRTYRFCVPAHRSAFRADPGGYFLHSMWGIPAWLYYTSIGLVMVLSLLFLEWRPSDTSGPRIDILRSPKVRAVLTSRWTRLTLQLATTALFVLIVFAGLFGNQLPSKNLAPILTWTVWWGGLVVVILFLGSLFCYACPWDALAGWLESLRLTPPRGEGLGLGLRAPRALRGLWPALLLFVLLTWIELGLSVTLKPRATAYLALGMLGLAVASALIFERKYFCKHLCLVGRISGLYSLFAPFEIRSVDPDVCRTCETQSCYKGNPQGDGCPTSQFPGTMSNNTYCTFCTECLRTCELGNMSLFARPWGEDLRAIRRPRRDEAALALCLLALTGFHGLTMTSTWRDLTDRFSELSGWGRTTVFSAGMLALLIAPVAVYAVLVLATRALSPRPPHARSSYCDDFVRHAYALLPIALFYHLAHNAEHLLMEGQKALALLSDPLGFQWDLLGTARLDVPPLASLSTLWAIQVVLVLVGHVFGVWATCQVTRHHDLGTRQRLLAHLPMLAAMVAFSVFSLWLLKQPMEMRTSAM